MYMIITTVSEWQRSDLAPDVSVNMSVLTVNFVSFSRPMGGFFSLLTMFYYIRRRFTRQGIQDEQVMVSLKFWLFDVIGVYFPHYKGGSRCSDMVEAEGEAWGVQRNDKLPRIRTCATLFFNHIFLIKAQPYEMISHVGSSYLHDVLI